MSTPDNTPVLIGVGQITEKSADLNAASSPLQLMEQATFAAIGDAGLITDATKEIDAIVVVKSFREPMRNTPEALANLLGATSAQRWIIPDGGYGPQYLVNLFSQEIAHGKHQMVLMTGAEAMATGRKIVKSGQKIPWNIPSDSDPDFLYAVPEMWNEHERLHGIWQASHVYPLFENALRHHLNRSIEDHQLAMGTLFSRLSEVAVRSPHAWFPVRRSPEDIAWPSESNRYVGWPYTKYMNAMNQINQSASVLLTSVGHARSLGVDPSRWVFLHGCADVTEIWDVTQRVNYHSAPAISILGRESLAMARINIEDITHIDLYSCFPSAVAIACRELGIPEDDPRDLTVTGGLAFHGGAGNNYVMNSIAAMADQLREDPGTYGLVTANGGYLSRHSAGIYSTLPPEGPWQRPDPVFYQQEIDALDSPVFTESPDGKAAIETYSVVFGRDNHPDFGIVIGRLGSNPETGTRFISRVTPDTDVLMDMTQSDYIGRVGKVSSVEGSNIFTPI